MILCTAEERDVLGKAYQPNFKLRKQDSVGRRQGTIYFTKCFLIALVSIIARDTWEDSEPECVCDCSMYRNLSDPT